MYLKQHEFVIWEGQESFTFYEGNQAAYTDATKHAQDSEEKIIMAAVKHPDGSIFSVERPGRHAHVIYCMSRLDKNITQLQGFVTSHGRFVNRVDGLKVAQAANQLLTKTHPKSQLFSEDLW